MLLTCFLFLVMYYDYFIIFWLKSNGYEGVVNFELRHLLDADADNRFEHQYSEMNESFDKSLEHFKIFKDDPDFNGQGLLAGLFAQGMTKANLCFINGDYPDLMAAYSDITKQIASVSEVLDFMAL